MRSIAILFFVFSVQLPFSARAQDALGDGRGLERNLRLPQAPLRDPLAGMQRRQFPLTDGLGGQRFDDRFVRDGLRFAPEFTRGNSIYSRSLLFDYLGYSGWDLYAGRNPLTRPEDRFDQIKRDGVIPSTPISPRQVRSNPNERLSPPRLDTRIDTRMPSNRIDTRFVDQGPRPSRIEAPVRSNPSVQNRSAPPQRLNSPPTETQNESIKPAHLSLEQMTPVMVKILKLRTQRRAEEKKIFGDAQDRNLSEDFWQRRGLGHGRAITLIGFSPSARFEEEISRLSTERLIIEAKNLRGLLESPSKELDEAITRLEAEFLTENNTNQKQQLLP